MVPKALDEWRAVLDISSLKGFLRNVSFHMETVASLQDAMHPGIGQCVDLRDAYFHLIHPCDRKWLHVHGGIRSSHFGWL